jgi:signal transduction histidine kinase
MADIATERSSISRWQRRLLPGELSEAPGARSPRDWLVDSALFAIALVGGVITLVQTWDDHFVLLYFVDIAAGATACLALWVRRSRPVAVGVLAVVAGAFSALAGVAALFAVFGVALRASRRALIGISALAVIAIVAFNALYPSIGDFGTQTLLAWVFLLIAISLGLFARVRRELVLSLRERTERLEAEQRLHIEQAREAERRRIAREMHDVLAHRLSLLTVHAGALEFRPDASREEVAEAARVIRDSARAALQELREVIGLLRDDGEEGLPQPPQPTFADIPKLIEESRAAGMNVRLHDGTPPETEIPAAIGRTAYRVVQEGLTNARKHAPGAAADVTISANTSRLTVEVVNRSPVGVTGSNPLAEAGTGTGLIGLAERVALAGGELTYGPKASGDFALRASLPWPE